MGKLVASLSLLAVTLILPMGKSSQGEEKGKVVSPSQVVTALKGEFDQGLRYYRQGDISKARMTISDAYFDLFEGGGMEAAIGVKSVAMKVEIESIFGKVNSMMGTGAPAESIEAELSVLKARLDKAASALERGEGSSFSFFISSLVIIVREGLEAILILSALVAYLFKMGNSDKVKNIYGGAVAALTASIVTALGVKAFFAANPAGQEVLEGVTMLMATAVLFYVSYWLTSKAQAIRWQEFITRQVNRSISRGGVFALGFTAFLVVYREGAEAILFYQALLSGAGSAYGGVVIGGFLLGCGLLVAIFMLFRYGSVKLPITPFFAVTGVLLFYMAFTFAGKGVVELQTGGAFSSTPVSFPTIGILGVYPTAESLIIQGGLIVAAAAGLTYIFALQKKKHHTDLKDIRV